MATSKRRNQARQTSSAPHGSTSAAPKQTATRRVVTPSPPGASRQRSTDSSRIPNRKARMRISALRRARKHMLWMGIGVTAAVLIIVGFLVWPRPSTPSLSAARLSRDPTLGPANAPITLIEYADFGCPTCQAWYRSHTLEKLLAKYPDKIHFVWRDFPIITTDSPKAAEAGQCAFDQGKFWQFHDVVYNNAPAISVDDLKSYASGIGLDMKTFDTCLDSGQDAAKVNQSLQEAYRHGFRGTPSFLLNGKPLAGPPSFDYLVSLIDPILAGK